jgi:hypothetical protein
MTSAARFLSLIAATSLGLATGCTSCHKQTCTAPPCPCQPPCPPRVITGAVVPAVPVAPAPIVPAAPVPVVPPPAG